jgi:transposase-like protein
MSKRIFAQDQMKELLNNPNVLRCSEKSITWHKDFKLTAVKLYQEGLSPSAIFTRAGFNLVLIGKNIPKWCLQRWRKTFQRKGEVGLMVDGRSANNPHGRPKDPVLLSDKEKLKHYEAQIAYLKAENDFLAKLRKQR